MNRSLSWFVDVGVGQQKLPRSVTLYMRCRSSNTDDNRVIAICIGKSLCPEKIWHYLHVEVVSAWVGRNADYDNTSDGQNVGQLSYFVFKPTLLSLFTTSSKLHVVHLFLIWSSDVMTVTLYVRLKWIQE